MQLHFTGKHLEMTPALKDFTTEKFQRLEKFLTDTTINIIFEVEKATHIAEATLKMDKTEIHAKASAENMYNAVDDLVDKLQTQITKQKDKMKHHRDA